LKCNSAGGKHALSSVEKATEELAYDLVSRKSRTAILSEGDGLQEIGFNVEVILVLRKMNQNFEKPGRQFTVRSA
jgi:hypothetical protein